MASIVITSPGSIGTADSDFSQLNSKKPSTANTWEMTFPEKMDEPKASATFAKRMLFLIVGYYFRLRDLYPSKAFKARRIGDLKISTLNKDVVPKLTKFLMSACKLIDQGYLEKFCVLLNDGKEDDSGTLEVFIVRFAYVKNDVTVTIAGSGGLDDFVVRYTGEDALREAARRVVIRMLMLTEPLKSVPKNAHKEFRIVYTDDTPRDFEADGYRACKHEYNFTGTEAQSITVGSVHAKYHALEASLKSVCMDDELTAEAFSQKLPNELQKTLPEAEKSIPVPYTGIDSITTLVKAREKTKSSDGTMTTSTETSKSTSSGSASASKKPEESTPPIAPLEKSPPKTPQTRSHRAPAPRRRPLVSYEASPSPAPSRVVIEKQPSKKRTVAEEPPVKKPKFVRSIANVTQLAVAIVEADSQ